jgi:hypothetical protein
MKQLPVFFSIVNASCGWFHKFAKGLVFATCFVSLMAPSICRAENGKSGFILPVALTELTALPDSSIAVITGTGLQAPAVNTTPLAPIILWDELHPTNQQSNINSGIVTITVNGVAQ